MFLLLLCSCLPDLAVRYRSEGESGRQDSVDTDTGDADVDVDSDSDADTDTDTDADSDTDIDSDSDTETETGDSGDTADSADSAETGDTGDSGDTGVVIVIIDLDGDGYALADDCDDTDAAINPSASEVCDSADNDCDGSIDEDNVCVIIDTGLGDTGDSSVVDTALPVDTSGSPADTGSPVVDTGTTPVDTGTAPVDTGTSSPVDTGTAPVDTGTQPVDTGTTSVDTGAPPPVDTGTSVVYTDRDGDGFYVEVDDCDDSNAAVNPDATEVCDGIDNDCDGSTDPDDSLDAPIWYFDGDGDGYGEASTTAVACSQPAGYVASATDCDDSDAAYNPGAVESDCTDPNDYNCDGSVGYVDADGDGWAACLDCDDSDAAVNPDATEVCDGIDNDCDGVIDPDTSFDASTWYIDFDGDGYGVSTTTVTACSAPSGYVGNATDCDDADSSVYPNAIEYCNGVDDNCDGSIDPSTSADAASWYLDSDADGYGVSTTTVTACSAPSGYVGNATDCDDGDATVNPGASETCNGVDDDCDGTADDGLTCSIDSDGDGRVELCWTYSTGFYGGELSYDVNAITAYVSTTATDGVYATEICSGANSVALVSGDVLNIEGYWYASASATSASRHRIFDNVGDTNGDGIYEYEQVGVLSADGITLDPFTVVATDNDSSGTAGDSTVDRAYGYITVP